MSHKTNDEIIEEFRLLVAGRAAAGHTTTTFHDLVADFMIFTSGVIFAEGRDRQDLGEITDYFISSDWVRPVLAAHLREEVSLAKAHNRIN